MKSYHTYSLIILFPLLLLGCNNSDIEYEVRTYTLLIENRSNSLVTDMSIEMLVTNNDTVFFDSLKAGEITDSIYFERVMPNPGDDVAECEGDYDINYSQKGDRKNCFVVGRELTMTVVLDDSAYTVE